MRSVHHTVCTVCTVCTSVVDVITTTNLSPPPLKVIFNNHFVPEDRGTGRGTPAGLLVPGAAEGARMYGGTVCGRFEDTTMCFQVNRLLIPLITPLMCVTLCRVLYVVCCVLYVYHHHVLSNISILETATCY